MNPILLQKQLRENAADLDDFYKELKSWGEDMKTKDDSLKKYSNKEVDNKKQKTLCKEKVKSARPPTVIQTGKLKAKLGYTDYRAWDNFDVDAECEKIDYDENEESELTDECDDSLKDQAYAEKENGNKFVKNQKWDEAIECYTRAINWYTYDPIFYANRALCYLKKEKHVEAEVDCTMSLKLDKTYVKAYQRRAAAREAINKLSEAEADILQVLKLEPNNKESRNNLEMLRKKIGPNQEESVQRPISKFTASRNQRRGISNSVLQNVASVIHSNNNNSNCDQTRIVDAENPVNWPSGADNIILVKSVKKPVHLQSRKPLKRIEIMEVARSAQGVVVENKTVLPPKEFKTTIKTDDLKIIERHSPLTDSHEIAKATKNYENTNKMKEERKEFCVPKNAVQFYSSWRHLKTIEDRYAYVKLIKPEELSNIFKESLESDMLGEILEVLAKCFIENSENVFDFLLSFTKAKRFSTFTMFMSEIDKKNLWKLFDYIRKYEETSKDEIEVLAQKYEL